MGQMTIQPVLDLYDKNPELVSKVVFPYHKLRSKKDVEEELFGMEYIDFDLIRKQLDLNPLEEKKKKGKVNPAYLTKDAAAMKKEIDRVKKLKSDDPSAYGKWEADYADKGKTKAYKTKKSAATSAYEKRFGKKDK